MSFVQHRSGVPGDFPSWVPRWDEAYYLNPLAQNLTIARWNTSQSSLLQRTVDSTLKTVKLRDICIDTISTFSPKDKVLNTNWFDSNDATKIVRNHPLLASLHTIGKETEFDNSKFVDCRRVLVAGLWSYGRVKDYFNHFLDSHWCIHYSSYGGCRSRS
jgi:hypothetical protein